MENPQEQPQPHPLEQKYLDKINQEYENTLAVFKQPKIREKKEKLIVDSFHVLSRRLISQEDFPFGQRQQIILKLKLARYLEREETVDLNTLYDAIKETPNFINTDKGGFHRLLEIHEQKTLQRIAEQRKKRAEITNKTELNPYEALFTTKSGHYYLARLLNMPHLEEESAYMSHCVGTSGSYLNRMKRGEIEILSLRHIPKVNPRTQKVEGDIPVMTIEYNLKTNIIEQMKKQKGQYLKPDDSFFDDVIDALKQLRQTKTNTGKLRAFAEINPSELTNIKVKDYHCLTDQGEKHFRDINPQDNLFILKTGQMPITPDTPKTDAVKIIKSMENIDVLPDEIATQKEDVTEKTKIWIGKLFPNFFQCLPDHIKHVYAEFPEGKITIEKPLEVGPITLEEFQNKAEQHNRHLTDESLTIKTSDLAEEMMRQRDFSTLETSETIQLIRLKAKDLGLEGDIDLIQIYNKAKEFNLDLCPPEVGPHLRLQYTDQPLYGDPFIIAMKPIPAHDGHLYVFSLGHHGDGLRLENPWAPPDRRWASTNVFVFRLRKLGS